MTRTEYEYMLTVKERFIYRDINALRVRLEDRGFSEEATPDVWREACHAAGLCKSMLEMTWEVLTQMRLTKKAKAQVDDSYAAVLKAHEELREFSRAL